MDTLIVLCAKYLIYVSGLVALAYLFFSREWKRLLISLFGTLVVSVGIGKLLGRLWFDPLPFIQNGTSPLFEHAANNGFPSDHTLVAAALAMAILPYNRLLGVVLWVFALIIGFSRVAAGVHHFVDVAAAALVALAVGALIEWILRAYYSRSN